MKKYLYFSEYKYSQLGQDRRDLILLIKRRVFSRTTALNIKSKRESPSIERAEYTLSIELTSSDNRASTIEK